MRFSKILFVAAATMMMMGCSSTQDIAFQTVNNYFYRNDATQRPQKIESQEQFDSLFGAAAFMGKDGQPTKVDFNREFVIAIVRDTTSYEDLLTPVSLKLVGDSLVFTYQEQLGKERRSFQIQPILLVKTAKKYAAKTLVLKESEGNN